MQVELADREKYSMLFLGGQLNFTYDSPGPREVKLNELTQDQKNQLLANWQRGLIKVDDVKALQDACGLQVAPQKPIPQKPVKDSAQLAEDDQKKLKSLLDAHHATIKKTVVNLRPAQWTQLLKMEKKGKKRKSVLSFLKQLVKKHEAGVAQQVGSMDLAELPDVHAMYPQRSTQVSDIVESEEKEVVLIPSDEELKVRDD